MLGVCIVAGGHAWLLGGACMVAGGHAWLLGGMHGCWGACIAAGGVNCLAGSLDEALYKVLMNINECGCRPYGWLGLDGNQCIRVIPRHPPFSIKKRLCLHAKKLLLEIYDGP